MIEAISVKALPNYKLLVEFDTGERKMYDFSHYLSLPAFSKLRNKILFDKAHIECGGIVWNDEIDIAPEALY